jgi:hypothetical protein
VNAATRLAAVTLVDDASSGHVACVAASRRERRRDRRRARDRKRIEGSVAFTRADGCPQGKEEPGAGTAGECFR